MTPDIRFGRSSTLRAGELAFIEQRTRRGHSALDHVGRHMRRDAAPVKLHYQSSRRMDRRVIVIGLAITAAPGAVHLLVKLATLAIKALA